MEGDGQEALIGIARDLGGVKHLYRPLACVMHVAGPLNTGGMLLVGGEHS